MRATARWTRARDGSGQGLVGMRERVRMFGGELEAGARADGGFVVGGPAPARGRGGGRADRRGAGMSIVASSSPTTRRWCAPASR